MRNDARIWNMESIIDRLADQLADLTLLVNQSIIRKK